MIVHSRATFHDFAENPHSSECGSSRETQKPEASTRLSILVIEVDANGKFLKEYQESKEKEEKGEKH